MHALASGPFIESRKRHVVFQETFTAFALIRAFLCCEKIDVRDVPLSFVYVADRLGLNVLFKAIVAYAEDVALYKHPSEGKKKNV